jgi:hypothetical protein
MLQEDIRHAQEEKRPAKSPNSSTMPTSKLSSIG